jgi:AAA domain
MSTSSHSAFSPMRLSLPSTAAPAPAASPAPQRAAPFAAPLLRAPDLAVVTRPEKAWLWHGYLAPGNITLLTSQWKSGKTTLISVLLARLKTGGQLAGLALAPGCAVVVSEESADDWRLRSDRLDFGDHLGWFCRPFQGPNFDQWQALIDRLADLHAREGTVLVVIDPLSAFFPGKSEGDALGVLETLMPLRRLAALGLCVLVAHHPRKGRVLAGQAARGSGALTSYADILIEMRRLRRTQADDRRRRLRAYSRYDDTPRDLVIELSPDGTDYISQTVIQQNEFNANWKAIEAILDQAPHKLTRADIRRRWPTAPPPDPATILRWLEKAVADGAIRRDGAGVKKSPFRYWLPATEEKWRQDPLTFFTMPELHPDLPPGFPSRGADSGG